MAEEGEGAAVDEQMLGGGRESDILDGGGWLRKQDRLGGGCGIQAPADHGGVLPPEGDVEVFPAVMKVVKNGKRMIELKRWDRESGGVECFFKQRPGFGSGMGPDGSVEIGQSFGGTLMLEMDLGKGELRGCELPFA